MLIESYELDIDIILEVAQRGFQDEMDQVTVVVLLPHVVECIDDSKDLRSEHINRNIKDRGRLIGGNPKISRRDQPMIRGCGPF